jgi:glycerol kinase
VLLAIGITNQRETVVCWDPATGEPLLAGVGAGLLTIDQVRSFGGELARYEPAMSGDERAALLEGWHRALERSRGWAAG